MKNQQTSKAGMSVKHYENFPVASILLPRRLRVAVVSIYRFARVADDIADEGNDSAENRLADLQKMEAQLRLIEQEQTPHDELFINLQKSITEHDLPLKAFDDLLHAFKQDVIKKRYQNFAEVLHYCAHSANPIGLLLLHLYKAVNEENIAYSNAICSALQLINFWQDVAVDWQKDRVYIPQTDLAAFVVTEQAIASQVVNANWCELMAFECDRARKMLESGKPLAKTLGGRIGLELSFIIAGGLTVLDKIEKINYDVFHYSSRLSRLDWFGIMGKFLFRR